MNKTSTMAGNKEEDPDNLVSLLASFEKDINQQVNESTDFDSINKAEMSMDDYSKVYSCVDPPIPIPDIVMEQQCLVTLISFILMLFVYIKNLNDTIANDLKTELNQSQFEKLITSDKSCLFYTNIDKIALFDLLHDKIAPLIRRRSGTSDTREHRQFKSTPKKFGPDTRLSSKDEFLLTLMKLRLGLLTTDLAHRFGISGGLCTQIFYSWIRGMSEYLKSFIYMPDIETVLATSPKRYKSFNNLIGIIDCLGIFIETPKSLEPQSPPPGLITNITTH